MSIFNYLIENNLVDKKEFIDLYSIRAIKINEKNVVDPKMEIKKGDKISIGLKNVLV